MPRTRVGSGTSSPWHGDSGSSLGACSEHQSAHHSSLRVVGVFGGSVVLYDHLQSQLLVDGEARIDLPPNALFASNFNSKTRFVLSWTRGGSNTQPALILLVNLDSRSVTRIPVPGTSIGIRDGVVNTSGEHVVLFDSGCMRLWHWTTPEGSEGQHMQWHLQELGSRTSGSRLPSQPGTSVLAPASQSSRGPLSVCTCGEFTCSSLLGHIFTFVRACWTSGSSAVELETRVVDVDADWAVVSASSTAISVDSLPAPSAQSSLTMHLRVNIKRLLCVLAIENTLVSIKLGDDVRSRSEAPTSRASDRPLFCVPLEQKIVDLVWLDEGRNTIAVLLARGTDSREQLRVALGVCGAVVSAKCDLLRSVCAEQVR
ncbi:hypothetical protein PybrP1_002408 [[Pythium] brassicae (nom. inval.)]|nr:hypothetical protein PybrP1_002408 [[Pythium] brassicae (nom. inval.)]